MSTTTKSPLGTRLDRYLRLREAAPELLAACKALLDHIALHGPQSFYTDGSLGSFVREQAAAAVSKAEHGYKFPITHCSQCGGEFGPGDHGYSHCEDHAKRRALKTEKTDTVSEPDEASEKTLEPVTDVGA